ncbi:MAG: hypothetical protein KAR05_11760, partial [Candidatus Omnitrophica bacterium]|nr:hypothetical protein [Candidatus Omnitrophota bacterium]
MKRIFSLPYTIRKKRILFLKITNIEGKKTTIAPVTNRSWGFLIVRPAGRTYSMVKVPTGPTEGTV